MNAHPEQPGDPTSPSDTPPPPPPPHQHLQAPTGQPHPQPPQPPPGPPYPPQAGQQPYYPPGQHYPAQYPPHGQTPYAPPGQQPYYPPPPGPYPPQGYAPYPPPPGQHPYPPGYGYPPYPPHRVATAMPIYLSAGLFLVCSVLSFIVAFASWDGLASASPTVGLALVGLAFSDDLTGNADFAISATMTVACSTFVFAAIQMFRLVFARWVLVGIGGVVGVYYIYAMIKVMGEGGGSYVGLIIVALLLWIAAVVVALLPVTSRAFAAFAFRPGQRRG